MDAKNENCIGNSPYKYETTRPFVEEYYGQRFLWCERFEPKSHFSRLSMIFRVNVVLNVDGIKLWLLTWLVNYITILLGVCQLSRDVIGYVDS